MSILDDARPGMNLDIRPQDDLFGHVNGTWLEEVEIPSDRASWGPFVMLADAAEEVVEWVGRAVVIHFEEGAVAVEKGGGVQVVGSLQLPDGFRRGATGAGDAFAAGYLYGLHEGWPMCERLNLAVCAAATSLTHPTPSAGVRPVKECLALAEAYPKRTLHSNGSLFAL